jgi:hypothetical protein
MSQNSNGVLPVIALSCQGTSHESEQQWSASSNCQGCPWSLASWVCQNALVHSVEWLLENCWCPLSSL